MSIEQKIIDQSARMVCSSVDRRGLPNPDVVTDAVLRVTATVVRINVDKTLLTKVARTARDRVSRRNPFSDQNPRGHRFQVAEDTLREFASGRILVERQYTPEITRLSAVEIAKAIRAQAGHQPRR